VFIRGGNWNNEANAGAFTLNLNNDVSNQNNNIGLRCAQYFSHSFGLNEISTDISPCQEDYWFYSFLKKENIKPVSQRS